MTGTRASTDGSFWTTLPGILSGLAALVAAVGGILGIVLSRDAPPAQPQVLPSVVERSEDDGTDRPDASEDSPAGQAPVADGRTLDEITSFVRERSVTIPDGPAEVPDRYTSYVPVTDLTGTIGVEVPAEWSDIDVDFLTGAAPAIAASTDLAELGTGWDEPGVAIAATDDRSVFEAVLASILYEAESQCTGLGQDLYDDGLYAGTIAAWSGCAGTETSVVAVAAQPSDGSFWVVVAVQLVGARDLDAVATILDSFVVL